MNNDDDNHIVNNLPKLQWACRRGMLELDILLSQFLSKHYLNLPHEDKIAFVHLLNCSDPELFAWLLGQAVPDVPELARIVTLVRQYAP